MEITLTKANFEQEVLKSEIPVIVDFWATWCRPCQMMGPIVDELADEYAGQVIVAKMDVDQCNSICARYGITNIPNFKLFKNGVEVGNLVGAVPKNTLKSLLDRSL